VRDAQLAKGDVIGTARIAGVLAAKRTADLIPLCHPLPLSDVQVRFTLDDPLPGVRCEAEVRTTADRRGDGGAHRRVGRAPHRLRHGQERGQGDADRGDPAAGEGRREVGPYRAP
jgi:hypothetical protein